MKTIYSVCLLFLVSGCAVSQPEVAQRQWIRAYQDGHVQGFNEGIEFGKMLTPREIPSRNVSDGVYECAKPETPEMNFASYTPKPVETKPKQEIQEETNDIQPVADPTIVVQAPSVQEVIRQEAAPVQSAPTYSGPATYGAPQVSGYKTTYQTRAKQVAKQVPVTSYKTVYETVQEQVPVQVPVMKRPVYQTVQEQYQVPVQKQVMTTETRTRTKTVMVPQQVQENYQVSVPSTVTEMQTRTRTKQVKVGEEEIAAPVQVAQTYQAAPVVQYRAPVYSAPMQVAQYAAPACAPCAAPVQAAVSYAAAPVYSAPQVSYQVSATPTYSTPTYSTEVCQPQSYSTAPTYSVERQPLFSSRQRTPLVSRFANTREASMQARTSARMNSGPVFQARRPVSMNANYSSGAPNFSSPLQSSSMNCQGGQCTTCINGQCFPNQ